MENKLNCPMNADIENILPCCEEKCAWWDEDAQACALLVLARAVRKVTRNGR